MKNRTRFILAVLLQLFILVGMIGLKWSTLAYGEKILLQTKPVDPWELFRGDYVYLSYEISSLDLKQLNAESVPFKRNDDIYVELKKQGPVWVAKEVRKSKPIHGELFIKGRVEYIDEFSRTASVNYGLDSYYVPEGQGKVVEEKARTSERLEVEVHVDKAGGSALSKILYKGKELKFE